MKTYLDNGGTVSRNAMILQPEPKDVIVRDRGHGFIGSIITEAQVLSDKLVRVDNADILELLLGGRTNSGDVLEVSTKLRLTPGSHGIIGYFGFAGIESVTLIQTEVRDGTV